MSYLKQCHHQVGHTQVHHEQVHRCIVFPSPQKHPQDKAVPKSGEGQHYAENCNLSSSQGQVPYPGLGQGVRSSVGAIFCKDPKQGSSTVRTVEGVQVRHEKGGRVVSVCAVQ